MPLLHEMNVIERCRISPSAGSIAGATLPTTFFDLVFSRFHPVQRLFFYEYPHPSSHFLAAELPNLKHSLAIALKLFYPLAGHLSRVPGSRKPEIIYSDGDSVSFAVALSGDDFDDISSYHARDAARLDSLLPTLHVGAGGMEAVLAVQVTVFPHAGVSVGTTVHHAVADGSTYSHFMKTWASLCIHGEIELSNNPSFKPPFYNRSELIDHMGLEKIFSDDLEELASDDGLDAWDLGRHSEVVHATFLLGRDQLRSLASSATSGCSPYALACGYVWSCLAKARGERAGAKNESSYFGFVTGCRARLDPPVPSAYFGNCLGICCVEARRSEITGGGGAAEAAAAIWKVIRGLENGGAFVGAENWVRRVFDYASKRALTVAGSPKLGVYGVDFGWGRPRKVELVSIRRTGAMSLAESREEGGGGLEIGMALPRREMEAFISFFEDGLSKLNSTIDY